MGSSTTNAGSTACRRRDGFECSGTAAGFESVRGDSAGVRRHLVACCWFWSAPGGFAAMGGLAVVLPGAIGRSARDALTYWADSAIIAIVIIRGRQRKRWHVRCSRELRGDPRDQPLRCGTWVTAGPSRSVALRDAGD